MTLTFVMLLAALLIGMAKGGLGPMGALVAPLLTTQMPVSEAIGLTLPLLIFGDWTAIPFYWRQWEIRHVRLLVTGAVIGVALGTVLLTSLSDEALRRILGVFTLSVLAYKLTSDRAPNLTYRHRNWHGWLAGTTAGFASTLANAGAPAVTGYLLLQNVAPTVFIATRVLFFTVVNLIKLPVYLSADVLSADMVIKYGWVVVAIPFGVVMGRWLVGHMKRQVFEWLLIIGLLGAGISLLR